MTPPPAGVLHPREAERVLYGMALDAIRRAHDPLCGCLSNCACRLNGDDDCDCGYEEAAHDVGTYAHRTLIAGDKLGTAAPPPSGALHPLALAYLEAEAVTPRDDRAASYCMRVWKAWTEAGCPIYTAAPPQLSADCGSRAGDGRICERGRGHSGPHAVFACECEPQTYSEWPNVDAARAPATPPPEPACGARYEEHVCALRAGHDYDHKNLAGTVGWENRETDEDGVAVAPEPEPATVEAVRDHVNREQWGFCIHHGTYHCATCGTGLAAPASPPARPPAVTRTIRERVSELVKGRNGNDLFLTRKVDALIDVLDEDEACRDADRRETR